MVAKGIKMSEESKQKMSLAKMGENNPMYDVKHTEKAKEKIRKAHMGKNNPSWSGGRIQKVDGYILIKNNKHPRSDGRGYVFEHRLIMEEVISRYLKPEEIVHHINGIVDDNRIENLMLFNNHGEHLKYHKNLRRIKEV